MRNRFRTLLMLAATVLLAPGERKMNKSKRSLKDFVWKGDCFGKK